MQIPQQQPPLDRDVAASRSAGAGRWGLAVGLSLAWLAFIEVWFALAVHSIHLGATAAAVMGLVLELSIGAGVVVAVAVARIPGGVRALGVGRLVPTDIPVVIGWSLLQFAARFAVLAVMVTIAPGLAKGLVSNNPLTVQRGLVPIIIDVLSACIAAPLVEELLCRGLILRAVMRRYGFAAGAAVSSIVFGLAHSYQQPHLGAALLIAVNFGAFGVLQCLLVRRLGRLAPVMAVHGTVNGVALLLALIR